MATVAAASIKPEETDELLDFYATAETSEAREDEERSDEESDEESSEEDDIVLNADAVSSAKPMVAGSGNMFKYQSVKSVKPSVQASTPAPDISSVGIVVPVGGMLAAATPQQQSILDVNLSELEEKPWRAPGADYFNYGFNETTWQSYCQKQQDRLMRSFPTFLCAC